MKKLKYCQMCGMILQDGDEHFQIVTKDWTTKKKTTLYSACKPCADKIENLKFKMPSFRSRKKMPSYVTVNIRDVNTRKTRKVYDCLPTHIDYIKSLEVPADKLKIKYKDGGRLYTIYQVDKWMHLKRANLIEAMMLLYSYQTQDEKIARKTKYANSVGFNQADASFLTGMCRCYECDNSYQYTKRQYDAINKLMQKYVRQITFVVNTNNKILQGV